MNVKLCPKCHSLSVRRSKRRSLIEYLAALLLHRPYRCRGCGHRYLEYVPAQRLETLHPTLAAPTCEGESTGPFEEEIAAR